MKIKFGIFDLPTYIVLHNDKLKQINFIRSRNVSDVFSSASLRLNFVSYSVTVFLEIKFLNAQVTDKASNQGDEITSVDSRFFDRGGRGYPNLRKPERNGYPSSNYPGNSYFPNSNQVRFDFEVFNQQRNKKSGTFVLQIQC